MNKEDLKRLYPIGSIYQISVICFDNPETAKNNLPKIGEWEYIGILDFMSFAFKRIK